MDEEHNYLEILEGFTSPSNKRDPRAIRLAAVTSALVDVIKSTTGGDEDVTAAKVFAKGVTALEGTLSNDNNSASASESLSTQIALLELLHSTIPHVMPVGIISATLPLTSRVLRAIIVSVRDIDPSDVVKMETKDELGGLNAVLRWTARVSTNVLKRLDAKANEKVVKQLLLETLISLFGDRRPKVRKAAQNGILEILIMGEENNNLQKCHPVITKTITSFVHNGLNKTTRDSELDNQSELMHLLMFLESSALLLNFGKVGTDVMELLAKLIRTDTASSQATDFVAFKKVKENNPKIMTINALLTIVQTMLEDSSPKRKEALDEFAPRVLASLLQAKPSLVFCSGSADFELLQKGRIAYGEVILAASERILENRKDIACKLLPLSAQMLLLLSKPDDEDPEDSSIAQTLMLKLTQLYRGKLPNMINVKPSTIGNCMNDLVRCMETVMEDSYRSTWSVSLKCLCVLIQQLHSEVEEIQSTVESLVDLRNSVPPGSASQHAIEDALSSLVQGVGIETFWKWINWNSPVKVSKSSIKEGIDVDRAWLLSTMKLAASTAQATQPRLSFFQSDILQLARACDTLAATGKKDKNFHHTRVVDLWGLFPCFCRSPSDVDDVLPSLTTTLGRAFEDKRYPELVPLICNGLSILVKDTLEDNITDNYDAEVEISSIGQAAQKLLPIMFKFVTETHSAASKTRKNDEMDVEEKANKNAENASQRYQQLQSVTEAISSLSRLSPKDFIQGMFKKVMHRLLEEMQSDNCDTERICSLLSLSQALIASDILQEDSVSFLYRALKTMIKNDEHGPRVQKRAYKLLAEMCHRKHGFFMKINLLQELVELLSGTIMTSQVAARHMRLKCINLIVDGMDESNSEQLNEILKVMPEVLLCLKDSNGKTREAAYQLVISMAKTGDLSNVVQVIGAALGAQTPHMRSAAVMALSRIVFECSKESETLHELLPSLLQTVLVLIDEQSREVIKSVIGFIRISVAAIPPEQLQPLVPNLIGSLLKYHKKKGRFRPKIKIILKKLVKLFGYEALLPHVPEGETRLLNHMRKLDEREKRRKLARKEEQGQSEAEKFDDMLDSDEEDSDDGRTLMTGMTGFTRLTGRAGEKSAKDKSGASTRSKLTAGKSMTSAKSSSRANTQVRLPDETDGEVVDMLSSKMSKRVQFAEDQMDDSDDSDGAIEFDDDGKLVVKDDDDDDDKDALAADEMISVAKKRRKLTRNDNSNAHEAEKKKKKNSSGGLGSAYKSKKAGGDVKKKGQKYEPYAFVPLDGRAYSKRNRRTTVEQMSTVVRQGGKRKR